MWLRTAGSYLAYTIEIKKQNVMAEMEYRASFITQIFGMIFNNLSFIVIWYVFYLRFPSVNGWTYNETVLLLAIVTMITSLMFFLTEGVVELSREIYEGRIDNYLRYPKNVLWQIAISKTDVSSIGDFASAIIIFFLIKSPNFEKFTTFFLVSICGYFILLGYNIIFNTMTFYFGNFENPAWAFYDAIETISRYPRTIYQGFFKVMIFTALPAFFITFLPVELVEHFQFGKFALLLAFTALFFSFAVWFFYRGLKRYESSNLINVNL